MSNSLIDKFHDSLHTGFIDKILPSELLYQPKLLVNKKKPKTKVLSTIIQELQNCSEFYISVAFVTTSGVATIINTLKQLEDKGIKGRILVSQYLNFTQPEALKRLLYFKNIELRIATSENSHSKGYIFKSASHYNLIIGSSNLTASALATNKEWNLKVSALNESALVEKVLGEFESDFKKGVLVTKKYIADYELIYNKQRIFSEENISNNLGNDFIEIIPNTMQQEALINLENLRRENKVKALLISATGTGKTYLSAFDAKKFNPKRLLFVVHRLNIANEAMKTFKNIFGKEKSMGLYSGQKRELDKDFLFSTVQTISKQEHLNQFNKELFDYIIIDESHRSGANSYQRLVSYFEPKFLLGMTATPERTDGNDIFSVFDHNIAYEIRLNQAMEEDMLSQFHYYGVTDITINNEVLENTNQFNLLTADERVNHIIGRTDFYGSDNGIIRGLAFCARVDEANELSKMFNLRGFKTIALSGENSEEERRDAIDRLESDSISQKLDYIFTVDIFNEGVDIPKVNQILMIRPTESAIIFIQQLGRGLRKAEGKGYLTVIDFIGNYKNNYLIPIALYGDTSYNKDSLRRIISEGSRTIPGASTINFDEITKERIFKSIDSANLRLLSDLKKDYQLLKYKLGRTPYMMDFINHGERDPFSFVEYSKSYFNFIQKVDNDFDLTLTKKSIEFLEFFSKEINNSKRVEESIILKTLITEGSIKIPTIKEIISTTYNYYVTDETISSCIANLNFEFIRKDSKNVLLRNEMIECDVDLKEVLGNSNFQKFLLDSVDYSIESFSNYYDENNYKNGLIRYNKYSRKDVCRLLNWPKDISSTLYGYRTNNDVTPCFVTYHKSGDINTDINYNDHFISPSIFAWESRSNRKIESSEIQNVIASKRILLFVKKEDAEGTDFYYLGDVSIVQNSVKQDRMANTGSPVVHFKFELDKPVNDSVYSYLTKKESLENESKDTKDIILLEKELSVGLEQEKTIIPFYNFYAAAGSFSEMQSEKDFEYIEVPEKYNSKDDYFACKIKGESMNKIIPHNSICIFKKYMGGSRNGKIVLVENLDFQDPDFNSAFTIKTYSSERIITDDGWQHLSIVLRPNSYDKEFKNIVINEENGNNMKVLGEFVNVL